jgi:UDP-GlcNAc:undecaprenyl-phosphate GlcNAc-1-phosphate transferase
MNYDWPFILTITLPIFALTASLFFIPLACKFALKYGFVDAPGGRKTHERPVPPVGGIVVFSVFALFSLFVGADFDGTWAYYIALFLILITGVIDDRNGVFPWVKFLIHFLAAFVLVIVGDTQIQSLGNLLGTGDIELGWASIPFSIACVVYIINAMNMMDGLDGLAAGKAVIIFAWFFFAALLSGWWEPTILLLIIIASLLGFLFYNFRFRFRRKAIIFLGDAGSMAIGLTIAWFAIQLSQGPMPVISPASVAWIIALPIIDAFGLLVARLKDKKHPFEPDRRHFHHHFIDNGYSVKASVRIILSYGFFLGAIGFLGYVFGIPEWILGWGWIILWLSHALLVMYPNRFKALLAHLHTQYVDKAST